MAAKGDLDDTPMADALPDGAAKTHARTAPSRPGGKTRELFACTVRQPPFAYAQVEVLTSRGVGSAGTGAAADPPALDALQVHGYCAAALRRFLGATGAAMPLDLLRIDGRVFWVRLPREDLSLFAAALAAWGGSSSGSGGTTALRLRSAGNWLGSLLGRSDEQALWAGS